MDTRNSSEFIKSRISLLDRTRESLKAGGAFVDEPGQVLDKALAKTLERRQEQLGPSSVTPQFTSVIVRNSTPLPPEETSVHIECLNNFFNPLARHQPTHFAPEDRSLPLQTFLRDLPCDHTPTDVSDLSINNPLEPAIPWSPKRERLLSSTCENFLSPQIKESLLIFPIEENSSVSPIKELLTLPSFVQDQDQLANVNMEEAKANCNRKIADFNSIVYRYTPDGLSDALVSRNYDRWVAKLESNLDDLVSSINRMCIDHASSLTPQDKTSWEQKAKECADSFRTAVSTLDSKLEATQSSGNLTTSSYSNSRSRNEEPSKAHIAMSEIGVDCDVIASDGQLLKEEFQKYHDWGEASDEEIEIAMKSIELWKKKYDKLLEMSRSIAKKTSSYCLDDAKSRTATAFINTLGAEFELSLTDIKHEDKVRCLFSLNKSSTSTIKYPTFSGLDEEDYSLFEKEMLRCFRINRCRREDQVKKLRDCLKAHPRSMIPQSMENIDEAWRILKEIYGDCSRVMNARRKKILSLGLYPKKGSSIQAIKDQVEWLLKLEINLQGIFDIGDKNPSMERLAFSPDLISTISELFPYNIQVELTEFSDDDSKEELSLILEYIKELRSTSQKLLKKKGFLEGSKIVDQKDIKSGGGKTSGGKAGKIRDGFWIPTSAVAYNPPQRDEKCRVCVQLDAEGDTDELYDDHHHSLASGCPRFASMNRAKKNDIVKKAKLCEQCLDEKFVKVKSSTVHTDCPANVRKRFYTCQDKNCKKHFWLCGQHVKANGDKIKKSEKYWSERGKIFAAPTVFKVNTGGGNKNARKKKGPVAVDSNEKKNEKDLNEAKEKLKVAAKGAEVVDIPEGEPLFLFSYAVGKTRPLNVFYDKGCSHIIFKDGVPGRELDAEITRKGPFTIKGVCDTSITVKDEWLCLLDRSDGSKQVVQGVAVDRITSSFPNIDVSTAVAEVKNDGVDSKVLQDLKIPKTVGGEPDILLGIHYESCHPIKIHTLPSGLFIAKLQLASFGNKYTGVIGGPHETFSILANQAGGTANLMCHFINGIQQFKKLGAPKIHAPIMSYNDVQFAQKMNNCQISEITQDCDDYFDETERNERVFVADQSVVDDLKPDVVVENSKSDVVASSIVDDQVSGGVSSVSCSYCGSISEESLEEEIKDFLGMFSCNEAIKQVGNSVVDDDKFRDLKFIVKMQEQGISLEYRCPRCRSCSSCRNAPDTERISAREEAEDIAIKDSIKIDFENKRIECSLPLRGKEEDFLSTNRENALRVLNAQCKKFKNDDEAKQVVIKSFQKLFDNNYARKFNELDEKFKKLILSKSVQHYLPWRVVYKESISTPCRCVMDASSKTPLLPNGKGGRCLNDICMKGRVNTLDLLTMLLRFSVGPAACAGDLRQFYPSINLTPEQWNLQRVLWRDGMNLDAELVEIVITTLIYGIRSVSALSEGAVIKLAEFVRPNDPELAEFLIKSRFVDDLGDSGASVGEIDRLVERADVLFESVSWKCKGWTISSRPPHPDVTKDGISIDVGGMVWYPVVDCLSVKIPTLHFGKKQRGKLMVGTEIFEGSFADMQKFCSKRFTRRVVVSKFYAVYDPFGLLTPVTASIKVDTSQAVKETDGWDDEISLDLHNKCVKNLWRLYKLKGMKFSRAKVPIDAVDLKMNLKACVDAATKLKILGVWASFKRKNGEYSCQLLIGRSLLSISGTIPMEELEALMLGSNLLWICRRALEKWVDDFGLFGDSVISICWVISEKKRLSLFHRNRCNQVRMNTPLDKIFHVKTDHNPSDLGTRPEKVQEDDIGPDSLWIKGHEWMRNSLEEAVASGIVTPAANLKLKDEEEFEFGKGLVIEKVPEILIKGHAAFHADRVSKLTSRAHFSNYIFSPTKYSFPKCIRVTARLFKMFKSKRNSTRPGKVFDAHSFRMFLVKCEQGNISDKSGENAAIFNDDDNFAKVFFQGKEMGNIVDRMHPLDDEDISDALAYWFSKGTNEVKNFNKKELVDKIAIEINGILFNRSRILDGQRFVVTAGFNADSLGLETQLNLLSPVLDRHSPIALSIALYVHENLSMHAGYETCYRMSLGFCHIIQGLSLFRKISEECVKCSMIRKKYLEVVMGPVSEHQLSISPAFYSAFCDLDGPYRVLVPGFEKQTRARNVTTSKVWIMTFVCPMSKLCNMQVIESKSSDGILEGLTRLGCETGFPKYLLLDRESSFMKVVNEAEIDLVDLNLRTFKEYGIHVEIAPVAAHNFTGLVERKIRTVQETFAKIGLDKKMVHATGLQTLCKLVENHLNNIPLGFSYGRDAVNSPLLKIITPNMLKMGRINSRCLNGPLRFPTGPKDLMIKVEELYNAFYRIWNISAVPKLIPQPKWFKNSDEVKVEDVVYFRKVENELSSSWTVGQIESVERSTDGIVRRVHIRYFNAGENVPRYSPRCVRSICRLFNIEDSYWVKDMAKSEELVKELQRKERKDKVKPIKIVKTADGDFKVDDGVTSKRCNCCCLGHCALAKEYHSETNGKVIRVDLATLDTIDAKEFEFPNIFEKDLFDDEFVDVPYGNNFANELNDPFYKTLTAMETNFSL